MYMCVLYNIHTSVFGFFSIYICVCLCICAIIGSGECTSLSWYDDKLLAASSGHTHPHTHTHTHIHTHTHTHAHASQIAIGCFLSVGFVVHNIFVLCMCRWPS